MPLSTFNQLSLSAPLPSSFKPWLPIGQMFGSKWRAVVPDAYLPLSVVAIGTNIGGEIMLPEFTGVNQAYLPIWTAAGALQRLQQEVAEGVLFYTGTIKLTREASVGNFGGATQQVFNYYSSPRLGFQIGSQLKHQVYISVNSSGIADKSLGFVSWIRFDTISQIEYATNSRLKRLYVKNGKIVISKISKDTYLVKLHEKNKYPSQKFQLSGTLSIWSLIENNDDGKITKTYEKNSFSVSGLSMSVSGDLIFNSKNDPNISKVRTGDFFELDKPWVIEDPSLLFEYGLNKKNGFYETSSQSTTPPTTIKNTIQAFWIQSEVTRKDNNNNIVSLNLWHAFTDLQESQLALPKTLEQEKITGESSIKGGGWADGSKKIQELISSGNASIIRVSFFGPSGNAQNFASDCVTGEFLNIEDNFFEIISQPRNETIEINIFPINSLNNISKIIGLEGSSSPDDLKTAKIFQQKFWFINELHYGYPYSNGLWQGTIEKPEINDATTNLELSNDYITKQEISFTGADGNTKTEIINVTIPSYGDVSISTSSTTSKTTLVKLISSDVKTTRMLDPVEKNSTGCEYLTSRFYKSFVLPADSGNEGKIIDNYYKKFDDWYFFSISTGKTYKIMDAYFKKITTSSTPWIQQMEISLILDGDFSKVLKKNSEGYIFIGDPFVTYSGFHGEMSAFVEVSPSVGIDNKQMALLYGNYYAGTYYLPQKSIAPIYVSSFAYGKQYGEFDIPAIEISVPGANLTLCSCYRQNGDYNIDCVFFLDTDSKLLVCKKGSCLWENEISQLLVFAGEPMEKDVKNSSDLDKIKSGNYYIIEMTYKVNGTNEKYFFVRPTEDTRNIKTKKGLTPYESFYIASGHNANTSITRDYQLEKVQSRGCYMPFDFMSHKTSEPDEFEVSIKTYFPSNALLSGECVEKDPGKMAILSILNGLPSSRGTQSSNIKKIKYIYGGNAVRNIDYFFTQPTKDAGIILCYSKKTEFSLAYDFETGKKNTARPSVFMLRTDNNSNSFYAPSAYPGQAKYAGAPLMILYDFDLRGVALNSDSTEAYFFGFTYEKIPLPTENSPPTDDSKKMFLAMYSFNLGELFYKGNTYIAEDENGIQFLSRFPSLKKPSGGASNLVKQMNDYGDLKYEFGHEINENGDTSGGTLAEDLESNQYPYEMGQTLVSILNQKNASFSQEQLCVNMDNSGVINLFVFVNKITPLKRSEDDNDKKDVNNSVILLKSHNKGLTWKIESDDNGEAILFSNNGNQKNPYNLGDLLFLIDSGQNSLIVKNLNSKNLSEYKVIATDVVPHNISAIMKENGLIYVYYYSKTGNVSALVSYDSGYSFQQLNNW